MKRLLINSIGLELLLMSPIAFSYVSGGVLALGMVIISTVLVLSQAILILILRWGKLFKHGWLKTVFWILSLINALIWFLTLIGFVSTVTEIFESEKLTALGFFIAVIIDIVIIVWMFKILSKQQ